MDTTTNTIVKIGCGILLGGILLTVSCVGMTGAMIATGSSMEKAVIAAPSDLKLGEPRVKVSADRFLGKAAWSVSVTNASDKPAFVNLHIDLLDKDGLIVAQDLAFNESIPAGGDREITGLRPLPPAEAAQIAGIRATLK
jgi:hypothetical protein